MSFNLLDDDSDDAGQSDDDWLLADDDDETTDTDTSQDDGGAEFDHAAEFADFTEFPDLRAAQVNGWSPEQRQIMEDEHGIVVVATGTTDDLNVTLPDDPKFSGVMAASKQAVRTFQRDERSGALIVTDELRSEIDGLVDIADLYPENHPRRAEAIQRAAHLAAQAQAETAQRRPFDAVRRSTSRVRADGKLELRETSTSGQERLTVFDSVDDLPPAVGNRNTPSRPWQNKDGPVTLAEAASWPMDVKLRFRSEHPDAWRGLLMQESEDPRHIIIPGN